MLRVGLDTNYAGDRREMTPRFRSAWGNRTPTSTAIRSVLPLHHPPLTLAPLITVSFHSAAASPLCYNR